MNQAALAVLIAGLLPIVCAGFSKWGAKDYDNANPRAWLEKQEGLRARANAAQQNSFEAFALFAAGVLLALQAEPDPQVVALTCWFFIAMRVLYIYCYISNRASLRSIVWMAGLAAVVRLYWLAF